MRKVIILLISCTFLTSCVVSTAAKIVKTTGKIAYGTVKGAVNGVSWAVSKANGKINEDRLDGNWKVVGVYKGSYDEILKSGNAENIFAENCQNGNSILEFKTKKSKFKAVHCESSKTDWEKYKFDFGKNPSTKEKENYLELPNDQYLSIVNVSDTQLILEGNLISSYAFSGGNVYLLEKLD